MFSLGSSSSESVATIRAPLPPLQFISENDSLPVQTTTPLDSVLAQVKSTVNNISESSDQAFTYEYRNTDGKRLSPSYQRLGSAVVLYTAPQLVGP